MSHSIPYKSKDTEKSENKVKNLVKDLANSIPKTIKHFFPRFKQELQKIEDHRKKSGYEISELLFGAINLFLFKKGSRNSFNNDRSDHDFMSNYEKLFGMRLPHMDTVNDMLEKLKPEELENFRTKMIRELIEKKVVHQWRLQGKYFRVAIDGTGVNSYSERHCEKCLTRTSKSGKTIYFHNVLEAKLVLPNGLAISLATEWIENEDTEYDKQDCELKAFDRLSKKLKKSFPRLPICIVGDGLYPNKTVFGICEKNNWEYIITLKNGNLRSVWEEAELLMLLQKENKLEVTTILRPSSATKKKQVKKTKHQWITEINYKGHILNWIKTEEDGKKYVFVTSLKITKKTATQISFSGRLRWKIENEGFNDQKNGGYELKHKYSEVSLNATKNYYQALQIAHMINQLVVLGQKLKSYFKKKITIKHLWTELLAFLKYGFVDGEYLKQLLETRIQIRLE
ncbi:hypothetical protein GOV03_03690 [Candidatus Woesearchaeota archaeon]|nr:hypothetical protein [Candidatus Woesearchaeota archaeon]